MRDGKERCHWLVSLVALFTLYSLDAEEKKMSQVH